MRFAPKPVEAQHHRSFYQGAAMAIEPLITVKDAANAVGAKYWQVQRAVKRGIIPSFAPFNSRKYVRLSDVIALIEASRQGGE